MARRLAAYDDLLRLWIGGGRGGFSTPRDGEPDTIWVVTHHDPAHRRVAFTRFTPGSRVCVLTLAVRPRDAGSSFVDIAYTYTGLSPTGNQFIDALTEDLFRADMQQWEDSVNHFLRTGKQLSRTR